MRAGIALRIVILVSVFGERLTSGCCWISLPMMIIVSLIPSVKYLQNLEMTLRTAFRIILWSLYSSYLLMTQQLNNGRQLSEHEIVCELVFGYLDEVIDELRHRQYDFYVVLWVQTDLARKLEVSTL